MTLRQRIRLALALLFGAEVVTHLDDSQARLLQRELDLERAGIKNAEDRYWMVEPLAAVWVPTRFPHGKNETRLVISPAQVPAGKHVTVIRW